MRWVSLFILSAYITNLYSDSHYLIYPFGENGKFKMLYDRRQGQQSLQIDDRVHLVYNGNAKMKKSIKQDEGIPLITSFDLNKRTFSKSYHLGEGDGDHHFSPVIWRDADGHVHTLHGCHKTPGMHKVFSVNVIDNQNFDEVIKFPTIFDSISYPTIYNIQNRKQLMYFRNGGHRGSWNYVVSSDQGRTWVSRHVAITDLNMGDDRKDKPLAEMDELSSYHCTKLSEDGRVLHVVFSHYDDNKSNLPQKFFNPRYKTNHNLGFKFNVYYIKINLETHVVTNYLGEEIKTPIDFNLAQEKCKILDTDHRGAGIPPEILLDKHDNPSFLHLLSADQPNQHDYYYIHNIGGVWQTHKITQSNHEWNCGHLYWMGDQLMALLLVGEKQRKSSFMDKHGGGKIEKWQSNDHGKSWEKVSDITPNVGEYRTWRFNNIKPVVDSKGKAVAGKFIFYGWNEDRSTAKSFLMIEKSL